MKRLPIDSFNQEYAKFELEIPSFAIDTHETAPFEYLKCERHLHSSIVTTSPIHYVSGLFNLVFVFLSHTHVKKSHHLWLAKMRLS